jgi:ribosomal protein S18 acetylase RimI-like enzyme
VTRTQEGHTACLKARAGQARVHWAGQARIHQPGPAQVHGGGQVPAHDAAQVRARDGGRVQARDAGQVRVRQAGGADHAALRAFLAGLSPRSRYLRFFAGGVPASPAMLRLLAGERPGIDALVATRDGMIIGHAMAVDSATDGGAAADVGVVVADSWQGRGVGSGLMRALAARAEARGTTALVMDVLTENRQVLAMIDSLWPDARHDRSGPYTTIHAGLH